LIFGEARLVGIRGLAAGDGMEEIRGEERAFADGEIAELGGTTMSRAERSNWVADPGPHHSRSGA
jgi:hypothetical protein